MTKVRVLIVQWSKRSIIRKLQSNVIMMMTEVCMGCKVGRSRVWRGLNDQGPNCEWI